MNLTIEQMREIVDGAPDDSASHCVFNDGIYFSLEFAAVWNGSWLKCNHRNIRSWEYEYGEDEIISLDDLRAAIADHDRTDYVSDIRNHISPMTIVQGGL